MTLKDFAKGVDFGLLRKQKQLLMGLVNDGRLASDKYEAEREALDGLVKLLDDLMDESAKELGEQEVFGESSNDNCLDHVKCPKCGQEKTFEIEANTMVEVRDDGTDEYRDMEWGWNSHINCLECGHEGRLWQFQA